jgi:dipeptidase D
VACAGGCETVFAIEPEFEPVQKDGSVFTEVSVSRLEGGHSGVDIHLGRGNAIAILAALLAKFADHAEIRIAEMKGGSLSNAIPRDASAKIALRGLGLEEVSEIAANFQAEARKSHPGDPDSRVDAVGIPPFDKAIPAERSAEIATVVSTCPNGVIRMSGELPGTVETSSNIGAVEMNGQTIKIITMQRSLVESEMNAIRETISRHMESVGFKTTPGDSFPPWEPARNSRILKTCVKTYGRLFNAAPKVVAIHAGLECGVIGRLNPGLDMVSFGPDIKHPHSPKEKVNIASVAKFWRLLTSVLSDIREA